MIIIDHVTVVYPRTATTDRVVALDDLTLTVAAGETLGLIGPSGSGKTTLGRCLTGLQAPTSGRIVVDGNDVTSLRGAELRAARRRVGVVFQHFNLLDAKTALDNVALPLKLAGVSRDDRRTRAAELLERVGLADRAGAHPAQLSGGQRQRVAIARALATSPDVLVCDEATSALDPASTASVLSLIGELTREQNLTTLLITHEPDVARACDRVAVLAHGRITTLGSPADALTGAGAHVAQEVAA